MHYTLTLQTLAISPAPVSTKSNEEEEDIRNPNVEYEDIALTSHHATAAIVAPVISTNQSHNDDDGDDDSGSSGSDENENHFKYKGSHTMEV